MSQKYTRLAAGRDRRDPGYFQVDNEVFEMGLSTHDLAAYFIMVRKFGDGTKGVYSSAGNMAKEVGMGRARFFTAINALLERNMIVIVEQLNGHTTLYDLIDKREWVAPVHEVDTPRLPRRRLPVHEVDTKKKPIEEETTKKNLASVSGSKDGANQSVKASRSEPKREPRRKFDAASMVPPAHVTPSLWDDFVAHRKELKAPLTERAARIILNKLVRARDANDALENAIANGWKGVFPKDLTEEPITQADEPSAPLPVFERGERVRLPDGTIVTVARYSATSNWVHIIDHPHAYRPDELVKEEEDH